MKMTDTTLENFIQQRQIKTDDPLLNVKVSSQNPLPIGTHTLELIVVDDSGNESKPAQVKVVVKDTTAPTAVLTIVDAAGRTLTNNTLEFGASFGLIAKGSVDLPPGKITRYFWSLVG